MVLRRCRCLVRVLAALFVLALLPRLARADSSTAHAVSVAVLTLDSDDAEEQAEALTLALRSRARAADGLSLVETTHTLGMLAAALRCPSRPLSEACATLVADRLRAQRFIYGYVTKGPKPSEVSAEVHLYERGEPDVVGSETYANNLKDPNDDHLRALADRILRKLAERKVGTLVVRIAQAQVTELLIDGEKRVPITGREVKVALSPGGHAVELVASDRGIGKRNVVVVAGQETLVTMDGSVATQDGSSEPPVVWPSRRTLGLTLGALGIVAGAIATVSAVGYVNANARIDDFQNDPNAGSPQDPKLPAGKSASDACGTRDMPKRSTICTSYDDASARGTVMWVTAPSAVVLLAAGAYLLFTDDARSTERASSGAPTSRRVGLSPSIGPGTMALSLSGSF
jgi:hypothetical protein